MDIGQLEAFIVLAQTKSFTRTAKQLHIAQSTVTTRIKMLEAQLGKALFERDNRRVELTIPGHTFLPYAKRVLELIHEGEKATLIEGQFESHLVIGSLHSLWDYVLFPIVDEFRLQHPTISLRLISGHSDDIVRKMSDGIVDIGLVYLPPKDHDMEVIPVLHDSICLVAHPEFEFSEPAIRVKDLLKYPYIHINWGHPFTEWYQSEVEEVSIHPLQVDHTSLLLKFIKSGNGIGFLLKSVAEGLIEKGEIKQIPIESKYPLPKRTTYQIYSKNKSNSSSLIKWIDFINAYKIKM